MFLINSIGDVRKALRSSGPVVGVGPDSFWKTGVVDLLPKYQILCIKEPDDLSQIRKRVKVVSLNGDLGCRVEKLNVITLLQHKLAQDFLRSLGGGVNLFLAHITSRRSERMADKFGYGVLSSRSEIRAPLEDKWEFRMIGEKEGLPLISGEHLKIDDLNKEVYKGMQKKYGKKLVFQITDDFPHGGRGTFFVSSTKDFEKFHGFVARRRRGGKNLDERNVTTFMEGESASISGCVTRHGVLTSRVQRQIIDIKEAVSYFRRSGLFCGHDWGGRYSRVINRKARKLAVNVGDVMYRKGYRGIFGIDLVVNRATEEVSLVECNSRYSGCFPVFSMMQMAYGEIPMDAWHFLEHLVFDYHMEIDEVQKSYDRVKTGAQLELRNLERASVNVRGDVRPGVYRIHMVDDRFRVEWMRGGFDYRDLERDEEFVLTGEVVSKGFMVKPGGRIGKVVFRREVLKEDRNELQEDIRQAVVELYGGFKLQKVAK